MNPRIQFRTYLPSLFRAGEVNGVSFLTRFLNAFELLFEGVEAEIEGDRDPGTGSLTGGGIPDLFDVASTPPKQFANRQLGNLNNPDPDFDFLNYLASWLGLSMRANRVQEVGEPDAAYFARRAALNRQFFDASISVYSQRGTLSAIDTMLRTWLGDELQTSVAPAPVIPIVTELRPPHTDVDTVFQLGTAFPQPGATLGFDTVLGDGPPYVFVVDLLVVSNEVALRSPSGLDTFERAARFLLDSEKPAHTCYQLRVRAHTMQLAAAGEPSINHEPAAQVGVTTLLWSEPWVFNSD